MTLSRAWGVLAVALCAVYLPTLRYGFVNYDDPANTFQNPFFNPFTLANVARVWAAPHIHLYIPVSYTVWGLLAWLGYRGTTETGLDLNPAVFHAANVLLFFASVWLVYRILEKLLEVAAVSDRPGARRWGALAGTLLFAAHPYQVESVAWVTSLKGTLAGVLCLASYLCYLRKRGAAALVLFVVALLSRPTSIVLPLWLAATDYFLLRRKPGEIGKALASWIAVSAVFVVGTELIYRSPSADTTFLQRVVVALDALTFYAWKLFVPIGLTVEYGRTPATVLASGWTPLTASLPLIAGAAVVWHWRRTKEVWPLFAVLLFLTNLLPVLGLKPSEMQVVTNNCDRYMFLSLLGPAFAVAWLAARYGRREWLVPVGALGAGLLVASALLVPVWTNSFTLWAHVLSIHPGSWRAYRNVAAAYEERRDYDNAATFYGKAVELNPRAEDLNSLGAVQLFRRHPGEAVEAFRRSAASAPDDAEIRYNLSVALVMKGDKAEAQRVLSEANALASAHGQPPFPVPRGLAVGK